EVVGQFGLLTYCVTKHKPKLTHNRTRRRSKPPQLKDMPAGNPSRLRTSPLQNGRSSAAPLQRSGLADRGTRWSRETGTGLKQDSTQEKRRQAAALQKKASRSGGVLG